jgi:hypothetical protein
MTAEKLYFETIKEPRTGYFVEYNPPGAGFSFALLHLTFLESSPPDRVANLLEDETREWLSRYPLVPIMASAVDDADDLIYLDGVRNDAFHYGWTADDGVAHFSWVSDDFTPYGNAPIRCDLREIFKGVPFRTDYEVKADANAEVIKIRSRNRLLKLIFFIWSVAIPAGIALTEYFGPQWLALIALLYSLWKAYRAGMKLLGYSKPTKKEQVQAEEDLKKAHYVYHCERNLPGFYRLRSENFAREAKARTAAEAKEIGMLISEEVAS